MIGSIKSTAATARLAILGIGLTAACIQTRPYSVLTETAEPLRTAFNNDAGHVRVMMLVAPT